MDTEIIFATAERSGFRLDKFLCDHFKPKSRTYFQQLIENGFVLVNGILVKKRTLIEEGDEIEVCFQLTEELSLEPENIPLDILFEDEHILAINKPAGMVVHPAPGHWSNTFVNALLGHCKKTAKPEEGLRPGIVHRLDKDTSGVLIAAKTTLAQQKLVGLFQEKKIVKQYLAITIGKPSSSLVSIPIGRHPIKRKEMAVLQSGKEAQTNFQLLAWKDPYCLILALPITGRTHQIRVHLKHLSAPILGDSLYGNKSVNEKLQIPRQLLHAYRLQLMHPITNAPLELRAPIPQDFKDFLHKLNFLNGSIDGEIER